MRKAVENKVLMALEKVVRTKVRQETEKWPACAGILYQPKRPQKKKVN